MSFSNMLVEDPIVHFTHNADSIDENRKELFLVEILKVLENERYLITSIMVYVYQRYRLRL